MYFSFEVFSRFSRVFRSYSGSDVADYQQCFQIKKKHFKDNLQIFLWLKYYPFSFRLT